MGGQRHPMPMPMPMPPTNTHTPKKHSERSFFPSLTHAIQMDRHTYKSSEGWTDGKTDGLMDLLADRWTGIWTIGRLPGGSNVVKFQNASAN